eukprot:GDKI01013271.1.p1 GENE.GDKI01013271.1~~GDKI01013271.1.p1  ORF type:complete len:368 (+),score=110.00 GDKI01013271.1:128-1231(+)
MRCSLLSVIFALALSKEQFTNASEARADNINAPNPAAIALKLADGEGGNENNSAATKLCEELGGEVLGLTYKEGPQRGAPMRLCKVKENTDYLNGYVEDHTLLNIKGIKEKEKLSLAMQKYFEHTPYDDRFGGHPAYNYCGQLGGERQVFYDSQRNEWGVCVFKDASGIEEWTLFRGPETMRQFTRMVENAMGVEHMEDAKKLAAHTLCKEVGGEMRGVRFRDDMRKHGDLELCRIQEDGAEGFLAGNIEDFTLYNVKGTKEKSELKHMAVQMFFEHPEYKGKSAGHPAMSYCSQLGGEHMIVRNPDRSESAVCVFQDDSMIEGWTLFRGPEVMKNFAAAVEKVMNMGGFKSSFRGKKEEETETVFM